MSQGYVIPSCEFQDGLCDCRTPVTRRFGFWVCGEHLMWLELLRDGPRRGGCEVCGTDAPIVEVVLSVGRVCGYCATELLEDWATEECILCADPDHKWVAWHESIGYVCQDCDERLYRDYTLSGEPRG